MRWWCMCLPLVLAATACLEPGSVPAPPGTETRLLLTVTFANNAVDELRITGTALAQNRSFGPFDSKGTAVRSGATIGLLFDPTDAGTARVCIEGRAAGALAASGCGDFPVMANALSRGTLDLQTQPPDGVICMLLSACCSELNSADQAACKTIVDRGDVTACATAYARFTEIGA